MILAFYILTKTIIEIMIMVWIVVTKMTMMPFKVLMHTPIYAGIWTSLFFTTSGILTIAGGLIIIPTNISIVSVTS